MMIEQRETKTRAAFAVLFWGALWGIFEASVGYALHQLPIQIGSYIWFPMAYFFMNRTHRATGRKQDAIWVALLSAAVKLINLLTPIRADYVINPAVSIVFESVAMFFVLCLVNEKERRHRNIALMIHIFMINTAWRLLYLAYLGIIAPAWIREGSILQDATLVFQLLGRDNFLSTLVATIVSMLVTSMEHTKRRAWIVRYSPLIKNVALGCLLSVSIMLQFVL